MQQAGNIASQAYIPEYAKGYMAKNGITFDYSGGVEIANHNAGEFHSDKNTMAIRSRPIDINGDNAQRDFPGGMWASIENDNTEPHESAHAIDYLLGGQDNRTYFGERHPLWVLAYKRYETNPADARNPAIPYIYGNKNIKEFFAEVMSLFWVADRADEMAVSRGLIPRNKYRMWLLAPDLYRLAWATDNMIRAKSGYTPRAYRNPELPISEDKHNYDNLKVLIGGDRLPVRLGNAPERPENSFDQAKSVYKRCLAAAERRALEVAKDCEELCNSRFNAILDYLMPGPEAYNNEKLYDTYGAYHIACRQSCAAKAEGVYQQGIDRCNKIAIPRSHKWGRVRN